MKAAANSASTQNLTVPDALAINRQIWGNDKVRGTQGTGDNQWFTPAQYLGLARQVHNDEAERQACEIRLRAERKAGALSRELETKQGARTDRQPVPMTGKGSPTKAEQLHGAGITQRQAKSWERFNAAA